MNTTTNEMVYKVYASEKAAERYIAKHPYKDTKFVIENISNLFYVVAKW
jgi:hypothetical protein